MNKEAARVADPEIGVKKVKTGAFKVLFRIFMQAFTMTFVAEWGDRSQITTIILAARENLMGVITGGIIGHAICTGLGVVGGRIIAQKISVRTGEVFLKLDFEQTVMKAFIYSDSNWGRRLHHFCNHVFYLGSKRRHSCTC